MHDGLKIILLVIAVLSIYLIGILLAYALLERVDPEAPYDDRNKSWAVAWPVWIIVVPIAAAVALLETAMDQIKWREEQRRNDRHGRS